MYCTVYTHYSHKVYTIYYNILVYYIRTHTTTQLTSGVYILNPNPAVSLICVSFKLGTTLPLNVLYVKPYGIVIYAPPVVAAPVVVVVVVAVVKNKLALLLYDNAVYRKPLRSTVVSEVVYIAPLGVLGVRCRVSVNVYEIQGTEGAACIVRPLREKVELTFSVKVRIMAPLDMSRSQLYIHIYSCDKISIKRQVCFMYNKHILIQYIYHTLY